MPRARALLLVLALGAPLPESAGAVLARLRNAGGATGSIQAAEIAAPASDHRGFILRQEARGQLGEESQGHRLAGLTEVERDLEETEGQEDAELRQLDEQITSLVQKRDALRLERARRARDVAFVRAEALRLRRGGRSKAAGGASQAVASNSSAAAAAGAGESDAEAAAAAAEAEADAEVKKASLAAAAQEQQQGEAAAEQVAKQAAALSAQQQQEAQQAQAKRQAEEEYRRRRMQEDAAYRRRQEQQQKMDQMADSADDSFKQFMKEEDGEDQMGDADYEDSANALAGAIGWDRKDIESKADNAVKQLTQAIGGKKVVQSLQGMMAGIR